jgi:hypothetical protein
MRMLFLISVIFFYTITYGQFLKPQLECYYGAYYYKRNKNLSPIKRQGITTMASVRLHLNITKNFSIISGIGVDRIYVFYSNNNSEVFTSFHLGFKTGKLKNSPNTSVFSSVGIELEAWYGIRVPLNIGIENALTENISWTFRSRLPSIFDVRLAELYEYTEIGLEIGLKVDVLNDTRSKPFGKCGNPFILQ